MKFKDAPIDVVVAGGGLAGLMAAHAMAAAGAQVRLVDERPLPEGRETVADPRTTALAQSSVDVLAALGLWDAEAVDAEAIRDIAVIDARTGGPLRAAARARGEVRFENPDGAPLGFIVENARLRAHLARRLRERAGVTITAPFTLADVRVEDDGAVEVAGADGAALRARLLIACDGRESAIRTRLGVETLTVDYRQTALTATIEHDKPHHGLAQEIFLPPGPFAALPMTRNRTSVVWTERRETAAGLRRLSDAGFLKELGRRLGGALGALSLAGPRGAYPLGLMVAKTFHAPRVALVSEAAHRIHPIAGQGLNVGVRDVAALHDIVKERLAAGCDIGAQDALSAYTRARRFDAVSMALATDGLNRLFSHDFVGARALRGTGLGVVQALGPLRKLLQREAAGRTGARASLAGPG